MLRTIQGYTKRDGSKTFSSFETDLSDDEAKKICREELSGYPRDIARFRNPSATQWYWIHRSALEHKRPELKKPKNPIAEESYISTMLHFSTCKQRSDAKRLKVKLTTAILHGDTEQFQYTDSVSNYPTFMLSLAESRSTFPDSINIRGPYDPETHRRPWYGRIHTDGRFEMNQASPMPDDIKSVLEQFNANPIDVSKRCGLLMGNCVYCSKPLTDPVSLKAGYGKVCASKWDMPYGD